MAPHGSDDVQIRSATPADRELVARLRARCYRPSYADEEALHKYMDDERGDLDNGDILLTSRGGRDVATTTSLRGEMNVRGTVLPCQGIAWVGTTHDARRAGGVASRTMHHAINLGRERGEALSSLMPFRASYYANFGYGICERRADWKVPPALLPKGDTSGFRLIEPDDDNALAQMVDCRRSQFGHARLGHGDVMFPHAADAGVRMWRNNTVRTGYLYGDFDSDGSMRGWLNLIPRDDGPRRGLDAEWMVFDTPDGFMRQLAFLGTLKDQYGFVYFTTPADRPIHLLLRETHLPHRAVEHAHATCAMKARNQVRVLDHARVLSEPAWPNAERTGSMVVRIDTADEVAVTLKLNVEAGRCEATPTDASPDFTCTDNAFAAIALGDVKAAWAATHGLASGMPGLLDDLGNGPLPFCREYF
ncbi:MAG: GNAT family N-acetyltransferase [Planctomycetota bacterium]